MPVPTTAKNQVVAYEQWLIVVQIAYRSDRQPAPFATGTYQIGVGITDPDGTLRTAAATYQPHGSSCSEGGQRTATGGIVTYTDVSALCPASDIPNLFEAVAAIISFVRLRGD
jgi:hypothetical protein